MGKPQCSSAVEGQALPGFKLYGLRKWIGYPVNESTVKMVTIYKPHDERLIDWDEWDNLPDGLPI